MLLSCAQRRHPLLINAEPLGEHYLVDHIHQRIKTTLPQEPYRLLCNIGKSGTESLKLLRGGQQQAGGFTRLPFEHAAPIGATLQFF